MELKRYILPIRRWWWLITAATLVAALSSFLATLRQPPVYQAITTLIVGRAIMDPNPSQTEFYLSQQLATNYADIANRDPVKNATKEALGLTWLPNYLAQAPPNGQFVEIIVTDTVPERAQAVANELANQLILLGPTSGQAEEKDRLEFVNRQLDTLEAQIDTTESEISKLQEELGDMVSARQISDTQNQIAGLQAKLASLQSNYASLLSNTESGALNILSVIEPAALPTTPIGPNKALTILLASAFGFLLSTGAAILLEYLDDTIKTSEDVDRVVQAPIIGYIADFNDEDGQRLLVAENPRHPIVEAYRSLRTNLEFAGVDEPLKSIFIASAESEDGKSSIAANLAVVMAQGEKSVIVMDADLRKPNLHTFFGVSNEYGLSDIFRGRLSVEEAMKEWRGQPISILTAGTPPPNPTELLGSRKMVEIMGRLESMADVVIIDGPPFVVADAAVLAARADGVLVVVRSGHTQQAAAKAMMEQIKRTGARVVGVAFNGVPRKGIGYFGGNPYYALDYYGDEAEDTTKELKPVSRGRSAIGTVQRFANGIKPNSKRAGILGDMKASRKND
jgi:polysaccharide biosynthesis transport protein